MSSIIGYTDLLLGESIGILGALQRKFLERVKASTERMEVLLDDLFQMVSLDGKQLELKPETVDLGNVIDEAILAASPQLRDRHIILRVDMPDTLPQVKADRDALGQIFIHLLKNAGDASPVEGEILLSANTYATDDQQEYILVQVADQGGGIPTQDLPRVFSRLYRADNPLIEGVGDTGVGLSIAKTLVEAHQGRIWVDTEKGKGSTFSVLIPLMNGIVGDLTL
jgi:signal transduction histidine kinase